MVPKRQLCSSTLPPASATSSELQASCRPSRPIISSLSALRHFLITNITYYQPLRPLSRHQPSPVPGPQTRRLSRRAGASPPPSFSPRRPSQAAPTTRGGSAPARPCDGPCARGRGPARRGAQTLLRAPRPARQGWRARSCSRSWRGGSRSTRRRRLWYGPWRTRRKLFWGNLSPLALAFQTKTNRQRPWVGEGNRETTLTAAAAAAAEREIIRRTSYLICTVPTDAHVKHIAHLGFLRYR